MCRHCFKPFTYFKYTNVSGYQQVSGLSLTGLWGGYIQENRQSTGSERHEWICHLGSCVVTERGVSQVISRTRGKVKLRALGLRAALVSAQADLAQPFGRRLGEDFSTGLGIFRGIVFSSGAVPVLHP